MLIQTNEAQTVTDIGSGNKTPPEPEKAALTVQAAPDPNEPEEAPRRDEEQNGVTQSAIVRSHEDGGYKIVSGHHCQKARELA